ncbi:hypothetical protein F2P81_001215 [Scophthalmus maximus]|uniref:Uncharacterized protein n=1 Tax=Scophthalmus maximus TaxID=52904 RepID=A0A6A4TZW0_SCOMX|nr:hypothetical protein F2P81_001215 [Scophthalmus maximus]
MLGEPELTRVAARHLPVQADGSVCSIPRSVRSLEPSVAQNPSRWEINEEMDWSEIDYTGSTDVTLNVTDTDGSPPLTDAGAAPLLAQKQTRCRWISDTARSPSRKSAWQPRPDYKVDLELDQRREPSSSVDPTDTLEEEATQYNNKKNDQTR